MVKQVSILSSKRHYIVPLREKQNGVGSNFIVEL